MPAAPTQWNAFARTAAASLSPVRDGEINPYTILQRRLTIPRNNEQRIRLNEEQLITYGLAALSVIALWIALQVAKNMLKIAFVLLALLALAFLLINVM